LFIEIARMAKSHFALTEQDAPAIAQICQRLDGIPLALELAAARIRVFAPEQIAARLDNRFHLLTGGSRTALPRQQTLRAMIDWSYDLLSEEEKKLLRRLSVFSGGWTFEAAEGVCPELDVMNQLSQLINKSLVIVDEPTGQTRYRLLETIRQYAHDKLTVLDEEPDARNRHLNYFMKLAQEAEPHFRNTDIQQWQFQLEADADNLRAAMEWGLDHDPEQFLNLVGSLALFEGSRVFMVSGRFWVKDAIARMEALPGVEGENSLRRERIKAKGWLTAGMLAFNWGEIPAAHTAFSKCIAMARRLEDPFTLAVSLSMRGLTSQFANDANAARSDAEESIALFLGTEDQWGVAMGKMVLSWVEDRQGNEVSRDKLLDEVHQLLKGTTHPMLHYLLMGAAMEARSRGDFASARSLLEKSLQLTQYWRSTHTRLAVESEMAHIARQSGDHAQAKKAYRKTILKWKETGHRAAIAHQLECLAFIARAEKQPSRAIRLMSAAEALRETIDSPMTGVERIEYEHEITALREQLSTEAFNTEWTMGRSLGMDEAIDFALEQVDQI
jgi:tetratricopeptide (TPR) repeat protein